MNWFTKVVEYAGLDLQLNAVSAAGYEVVTLVGITNSAVCIVARSKAMPDADVAEGLKVEGGSKKKGRK